MNVLLTGSTASHVSQDKNSVTRTFHGDIYKALTSSKYNVTWIDPSVSMSREFISEFDYVLVGLAPPTSTAAHRMYGSLSVIKHSWEEGNLRLIVDAPEPRRIWTGLKAIKNNPENLIKDFYSKRKEYRKTSRPEVFNTLNSAISLLCEERWPTTIFPAFPWMSFSSVSSYIPNTSVKNLVGVNFDFSYIDLDSTPDPSASPRFWLSDVYNSAWTKKQELLIDFEVKPLRHSRKSGDAEVIEKLRESMGCLVSTYRSGDPWWSSAVCMSFEAGVPVATDWTLSSILGDSWRMLPPGIEELSQLDRQDLVFSQKESYRNSLLNWNDSVESLNRALKD